MLTTSYFLAVQEGAFCDHLKKMVKHFGGDVAAFGEHTPVPLTAILDIAGQEESQPS